MMMTRAERYEFGAAFLECQTGENPMQTEYDAFLDALYRAPNAVACGMCERRAHEFGKTVREVCADFKAKYGGYL